MRALWVKAGRVVNIVEYPNSLPEAEQGNDVVPAVTGLESIGDVFDATDALKERQLNRTDQVIFQELFRLTNAVRTLQGSATLTPAQYRNFVKSLL